MTKNADSGIKHLRNSPVKNLRSEKFFIQLLKICWPGNLSMRKFVTITLNIFGSVKFYNIDSAAENLEIMPSYIIRSGTDFTMFWLKSVLGGLSWAVLSLVERVIESCWAE